MSATTGQASAKVLRLSSARRRVRAFLEQIEELEAADFPHEDGREALAKIKEQFLIRRESLSRLPDTVTDDVVDQMCANTSMTLSKFTEVLGFILRSTNVRNAFEVHFPLKRLIQQTIAKDAKLVMSSEWNFVPFTWPMNLPLLEKFVLVGGPAPESSNMLIVPLAGHEIGHSAWRCEEVATSIQPGLTNAINDVINAHPQVRDRILEDVRRSGHDVSWLQHACLAFAIKQLEELFCDMFGLYVFGPAYLYAYEYFLAPGDKARSSLYPSSRDRVGYLLNGAQALGLEVEPDLFDRWIDSANRPGTSGDVTLLADKAVRQSFEVVRDHAFAFLRRANVPMCSAEGIERVASALSRGVPDGEGATLAEIVTAGWRLLRNRGGLSLEDEQPEHLMLHELMLKSVEVSEFRLRVANA